MGKYTQTFQEIPSYAEASKKCSACGKTMNKTLKRFQTINPWNQKTSAEIREENHKHLKKDVSEWQKKEEKCAACIKAETPDVKASNITQGHYALMKADIPSVINWQKQLRNSHLRFEQILVGKSIDLENGKIGVIDSISLDSAPEIWVFYTVMRKDKKGMTNETGQKRIDLAAKPPTSGGAR